MLMNSIVWYVGVIHLSGYVMPEDEFPGPSDIMTDSDKEDEEEEELESDEDVSSPGVNLYCQLYFQRSACLYLSWLSNLYISLFYVICDVTFSVYQDILMRREIHIVELPATYFSAGSVYFSIRNVWKHNSWITLCTIGQLVGVQYK